MLQRKSVMVAAFACVAAGGAAAANAPTARSMAECRLEYTVAQAELKKLTVQSTEDHSDEFWDDVRTEYQPAKIKPFGIQAKRFVFVDYADPDGSFHNFATEIALPYDKAKPKILKALGLKQCDTSVKLAVTDRCRLSFKNDGGKHSLEVELVQMTTGNSMIQCTYYD